MTRNGCDVVLVENIDRTETLPRADVALGTAATSLLEVIFDHVLVIHGEAGVGVRSRRVRVHCPHRVHRAV